MDKFGVLVGKALVLVVMAGAMAGCLARPVGDFGRADPSFTHDTAMPVVGKFLAQQREEPVSGFNQTDQETEMHNRVWRFLVAAHAKDWFYDTAVEWQRTRLTPTTDTQFAVNRYYIWLKTTQYQSSPVRYSTVGRHISADLDTIPGTFKAICAVIEVDRQRAAALSGLRDLGPAVAADVAARENENNMHIAWFVRALNYRYESYGYALDNLLVETPHEQSMAVDNALQRLAAFVGKANRRDFCGGAAITAQGNGFALPSRYATQIIDREIVLPK